MFGVAWAFVAHTDSHFDTELLCRFVRAYQEVQPLTIGELWAVAITLRIVLVENLRRLAELIMHSSVARQEANALADRLLGVGGHAAEPASTVLAEREGMVLPDAFAVQLVHRLRDQDPSITPALTWLDQHLAAQGSTADTVVHDEHQRQGAGIVTVRNIITSMRMISDVDWPELFERVSLVDDLLAAGSAFRAMDFPTRNLIATPSSNCRAVLRTEFDVASRVPSIQRAMPLRAGRRRRRSPRATPATTCSAADAARSRRPSASARRRVLARTAEPGLGIGGYVGAGTFVAALFLACLCSCCSLGSRPGVARSARCSGVGAGCRCGGGGGQPRGDARLRRDAVAGAGTARRRSRASAHAGRRANSADHDGGDRGADRAAGDPPPGEPGRRAAFALLSDWVDAATQHVDGTQRCWKRPGRYCRS